MAIIVLCLTPLSHRTNDKAVGREKDAVTENDLEHLLHLLEGNGEMEWQCFMDKSTPNMAYQAWRHEPEVDFPNFTLTSIFGNNCLIPQKFLLCFPCTSMFFVHESVCNKY